MEVSFNIGSGRPRRLAQQAEDLAVEPFGNRAAARG
jgi:hypothetical protein